MLARQRIIPRRDARLMISGLKEIEKAWEKGKFKLDPSQEDVHSNVEAWLVKRYGIEVGGKLHTARSRNDQVALDIRLYLRDVGLQFITGLSSLVEVLLRQARKHQGVMGPGYTHHQPAQVTTLGHIWFSFAVAFSRDLQRFQDWYGRFNENPLGSMTGYGTTFPIDRRLTSKLLGFDGPSASSLDPIQNRWEAEADLGFAATAMMNHLSSLAQTLILFSTGEFGLVRLDDAHTTGSSMMPQKRNPDPLEVMKAKASVVQGLLSSLLSIGKALFLGYNRDTQWAKYLVMDLVDECLPAPELMGEIILSLKVDRKAMATRAGRGFIAAPELVEQIVQEWKVPFRQAKGAVERAIRETEKERDEGISLPALNKALRGEGIKVKLNEAFMLKTRQAKVFIPRRVAEGGPSPRSLRENVSRLEQSLRESRRWVYRKVRQKSAAKANLARMERAI